jgi:hypothetical protein
VREKQSEFRGWLRFKWNIPCLSAHRFRSREFINKLYAASRTLIIGQNYLQNMNNWTECVPLCLINRNWIHNANNPREVYWRKHEKKQNRIIYKDKPNACLFVWLYFAFTQRINHYHELLRIRPCGLFQFKITSEITNQFLHLAGPLGRVISPSQCHREWIFN